MRYSKIDFEHLCQFADTKFYEDIVFQPQEQYIPSASEKQLRVKLGIMRHIASVVRLDAACCLGIMFCHVSLDESYVSVRVKLSQDDPMYVKNSNQRGMTYFPAEKVPLYHGTDKEFEVLNSVEIARVYADNLRYCPRFSAEHDYTGSTIHTTFDKIRRFEDNGRMFEEFVEGIARYRIAREKMAASKFKALKDVTSRQFKLFEVMCSNKGTARQAPGFMPVSADFMRLYYGLKICDAVGANGVVMVSKKLIFVHTGLGHTHIHIEGLAWNYLIPHDDGILMRVSAEAADNTTRYMEFCRVVDRIPYANKALKVLLFDAYVIQGLPICLPDFNLGMYWTNGEEYLEVQKRKLVIKRDSVKRYLWTIETDAGPVRIAMQGKEKTVSPYCTRPILREDTYKPVADRIF